jgi:tetratricopeptide (TPR) repeat protein
MARSCGISLLGRSVILAASVVLLLTGANCQTIFAQQGQYFSPRKLRDFADYLYESKDYLRAAAEYQRFLAVTSAAAPRDSIVMRIAKCYSAVGRSGVAHEWFAELLLDADGPLYQNAAFGSALSYHQSGRYNESLELIRYYGNRFAPGVWRSRLFLLQSFNHMFLSEWDAASKSLNIVGENLTDQRERIAAASLLELAERGENLPRRSGALAGTMSAIVPGSGKIYCGRYRDGLYAFVATALAAWQAQRGFERDGTSSMSGWAWSTFGVFLYTSGIYGSVGSARDFNVLQEKRLLNAIAEVRDEVLGWKH